MGLEIAVPDFSVIIICHGDVIDIMLARPHNPAETMLDIGLN